MKTIAKISEETLTLINYLEDLPHGYVLTYMQIEKETGVKMDLKGKSYLRTACKKLNRIYSPNHGVGFKLADKDDTMSHVVHGLKGIHNKVKNVRKTTNTLIANFYNELQPAEQKNILYVGACFGAIEASYKSGMHSLKQPRTEPIAPMLPENIK